MKTKQEECKHEPISTTSKYCSKCNKNLYNPQEHIEEESWEKEFEERFGENGDIILLNYDTPGYDDVKDFFRQTLQSEREKAYQEGIAQGGQEAYVEFFNKWGSSIKQQTKEDLIKEIVEWIEKNKYDAAYHGGDYETEKDLCLDYNDLKQYLNKIK